VSRRALASAHVQLAILAGRGVNPHLARWAARFEHCKRFAGSADPGGVPAARNRIFQWFRDECRLPWLLMMDDDCVPVAGTERLLSCAEPIAAARVWARTGRQAHPHTISVACLKVHRQAVERIRPPWFRFGRGPGACECVWFFGRACRAGFRPVQAGLVGHRFPVTVLPPEHGDGGPRFLFDAELRNEPETGPRPAD